MTWCARITDGEGNSEPNEHSVCPRCKHQSICQIHKVRDSIGTLLTNVDTHCDGKWANGEALLKCNGFEVAVENEGSADSG